MQKNKALIATVIGLGFILMAGFIALIYGFYQKSSDPNFKFFKSSNQTPAAVARQPEGLKPVPAKITIPLSPGSRVKEIETDDGQIIVHLINGEQQDSILILDARTGAVIRRILFKSSP